MTKLVLLAPPAVASRSQEHTQARHLGVPAISTGEPFWTAVADLEPPGRLVPAYLTTGQRLPDPLISALPAHQLTQQDTARGFRLDRSPRTLTQTVLLDAMLAALRHRLDAVIALQHPDDTADASRATYDAHTAPLIDHYDKRGYSSTSMPRPRMTSTPRSCTPTHSRAPPTRAAGLGLALDRSIRLSPPATPPAAPGTAPRPPAHATLAPPHHNTMRSKRYHDQLRSTGRG
jgi:hypothetical protein